MQHQTRRRQGPGGIACYFAVTRLKHVFKYDDTLDAFGVHGIGSTVGMLLLGVLASVEVNPAISTTFKIQDQVISLHGNATQLWNQFLGVVISASLAATASYIILKVIDVTIGLRISEEDENFGLDLSQHGEDAYNDQG